ALRLRPLRRRGGTLVGHARGARAHSHHPRRRRAARVALRPASSRHRADPRLREPLSWARAHDDSLGGGYAAQGIQGAARLVRARRHARLHGPQIANDTPGGIPPPGSATSWGGPYGVYFSLALPRGLAIIPSGLREAPGGESHTHSREDRQHGEEEVGVWRLLDQLQGLQGQHGVRDGLVAHRPLRDDEEDLGLREAEETRQE